MSFPLTRPPSPPHNQPSTHRNGANSDVDLLASALHNALQGISTHASSLRAPSHDSHDMAREKDRFPSLDIQVNSDLLVLKGTGVDVAPTLLSGNLVLHLAEATSIKEITLSFRGKARLPPSASEPLMLNSSAMTYLVCNHEWSFLEGEKKHGHTLKPGRHLFPFQLQIGGSLPSSLATPVLGGASVAYKLRALATRPGLAPNLQAQIPIALTRAFAPEALEYQQTLEIENTWPDKLMYSIMIPHKAWAAGDTLTAVVKFAPLAKGARVLSVLTTLNETVKLYARAGWQETTRPALSAKHEIVAGRAVCVDHHQHRYRTSLMHHTAYPSPRATQSVPTTPGAMTPFVASGNTSPGHMSPVPPGPHGYFPALTATTTSTSTTSSSSDLHPLPSATPDSAIAVAGPSSAPDAPPRPSLSDAFEPSDTDVVTRIDVAVPLTCTPTHALEPIVVSHRIRWSILIANLDGHTSELRCSLPLHVLDPRLLDDARLATAVTRRLMLAEVGGVNGDGSDADAGAVGTDGFGREEDMELPSYAAHVRDRVANMYLPDAGVMRVTNPWIHNGISPVQPPAGPSSHAHAHSPPGTRSPPSAPRSGAHTPAHAHSLAQSLAPHHSPRPPLPAHAHSLDAHPLLPFAAAHAASSHLPPSGGRSGTANLEYVNSELLLSLSQDAPPALARAHRGGASAAQSPAHTRSPPHVLTALPLTATPPDTTAPPSRAASRPSSRRSSRRNSRASSPEPHSHAHAHPNGVHQHPLQQTAHASGGAHPPGSAGDTYVHAHGSASRGAHGLFHISMKPFTSLASMSPFPRAHSHSSLQALPALQREEAELREMREREAEREREREREEAEREREREREEGSTAPALLHRAFTEVPDYGIAARGFLGGVPPLTSMRGLPSYEEAEMQRERAASVGAGGAAGAGAAPEAGAEGEGEGP